MKQGCHKRDIRIVHQMAFDGKSVEEISRSMRIYPAGIEAVMPSAEDIKEEKARIKKAKQKAAKEAKEVANKADATAKKLAADAEEK